MTGATGAGPEVRSTLTCSDCGAEIDCCEFCDGADCSAATCITCVDLALGQAMAQPHGHGG